MNGLTSTVANLYNVFEPDLKVTPISGKYFKISNVELNELKLIDGVLAISQSISDKALLKNFDKQTLVSIKGIDKYFNKVTKIDSAIVQGIYGLNDSIHSKIKSKVKWISVVQFEFYSMLISLSTVIYFLLPIKVKWKGRTY